MKEFDSRIVDFSELEIRDGNEKSEFIGQIAGYPVVFNSPSISAGPYLEYINPSALDNVDLSNVLALYGHDYSNVLGRVSAGTLRLSVDDKGLYFELDVPDTSLGRDIYTQIKLGNLQGMSFGMIVAEGGDKWVYEDGKPVRTVTQIDKLKEISVVSVPAYEASTVQATRSLDTWKNEKSYLEKVSIYLKGNVDDKN
ncbi:HK97 family phage prohead protease [Weissella coleopterorum]|uniref:HK97 family phage prohead protease n=1 Tax=Weissella coleopterorum TaxID=2714949 RepID=A0A6G8AXN2_9LACO|nr:HK97 family phage prohead protease [Weissella coleopterorum]QIL49861.1 HK97 family phage prohead protease [Weissella coleopterorum]